MTDLSDPLEFSANEADAGVVLSISEAAAWIEDNEDRVTAAVRRYFSPHRDQQRVFQGQHFEWFISRSAPSRFTTDDLAAIGALAVAVPAQTARDLVEDAGGRFAGLLAECHAAVTSQDLRAPELDLTTCPEDWVTSDTSPFVRLYTEVRALPGVGYVTCSKLLATKYPALIPIRDSRVEKLLQLETSHQWWRPMRELLEQGKAREVLTNIDLPSGTPCVTVLRRLDVALWMEARSRGIR